MSSRGSTRHGNRSVENFDEYNPKKPIINSPRSIEACKRLGVQPEDLVYKPPQAFVENNTQDEGDEIVQLKWQHYEDRRKETLTAVREERGGISMDDIVDVNDESGGAMRATNFDKASAIEKEQRAIEAMKARRQAELDQMIAYELKLQEVAADQQRQQERERQRELEAQKARLQRQKEWEDQRKAREEAAHQEEVEMEKERRRRAAIEFQAERERQQAEMAKEEQRKREAREREFEARRKREEYRKQTEAIMEEQQRRIEERRKEMQLRDEKRIREMNERRIAMMVEHEEARQRTAMRIQNAIETQKTILLKKRKNFHDRQQRNELRRKEFDEFEKQKIRQQQQRAMQRSQEIKQVLEKMELIEEEKRNNTLEKERLATENIRRIKAERERENTHRSTMQNLKQKDKLDMVERMRLMDAYNRDKLRQKIRQDDFKTKVLLTNRQELLEQRMAIKRSSEMERQRVVESIEKMRTKGATSLKKLQASQSP